MSRADSRDVDELDIGDVIVIVIVIVIDHSVGELETRTFATVVELSARGPRIVGPNYPLATYANTLKIDGKTQYKKIVGRDDQGSYHLLRRDRDGFDVVDYISDVAAGDARHAITLLRRGVREATKIGDDKLTVDRVQDVRTDAREEIHERHVDTLGTHQRHLYEIVRDAGEISSTDLHARYEERVADPKAKSTRRNYIQSLERYELIRAVGKTRSRRYEFLEP